jgi:large subunit ribosomal protein L10
VKIQEKKQSKVDALVAELQGASAVYLVNYQGITVAKDNALRMNLQRKGVVYRAVKNTILKRALAGVGVTGLDGFLKGATAVMVGRAEDPMLPAREIVEFHKQNPDFLEAKAISLDGQVMPGSKLEDVSKMPGRLELLGQVVSMILGPGAQLVALFKGPGATLAGQVKALEEKLEKAN